MLCLHITYKMYILIFTNLNGVNSLTCINVFNKIISDINIFFI